MTQVSMRKQLFLQTLNLRETRKIAKTMRKNDSDLLFVDLC